MRPKSRFLSIISSTLILCSLWSTNSAGEPFTTQDLMKAIQARNPEEVDKILKANSELADAEVAPGVSIMLVAVFTQGDKGFIRPEDNQLVQIFLKHKKKLDLFESSVTGNLNSVKELFGTNTHWIDTVAASSWTLLHFAAFSGSLDLVKYYIEKGADINKRAWKASKITPMQAGLLVGRVEISKLFLDEGADPLVRATKGFSAMHESAIVGDTTLIRLFYERGSELNSKTDEGKTPLDLAKEKGHEDAARYLESLGAEN